MKIYLATSFSTRVDGDGRVHPHFRQHVEAIINALEAKRHRVFCAVKHEGWVIKPDITPGQAVRLDLGELEKSECVLAILHEDASRGVQYEMGYAIGLGKQVIIATEPQDKIAYFNQGLIENGTVTHLTYKNAAELAEQI